MEKSAAELFLNKHRVRITHGVRSVKVLVDFLTQPRHNKQGILKNEMASKICAASTREDQMRELYKHLNSTTAYELTLEWIKKNEPHLFEELEKSQTDSEARARKRLRRSEDAEDLDKTDNHLNKPSLKTFSTLAKLEKWVSDPENSQKLIDKLEKKIQTKGLEALKEELKNKKLKKGFCFSADEVREIEKNKKLCAFFQKPTNAEFPEVAIKTFFQGKGKNDFMPEKDEYNDSDRCRDSGYDSLSSSQSDLGKNSFSESVALDCMEDNDSQHNEQNNMYVHSAQGTNGTKDQTQTRRADYTSLDKTTGEMRETGAKPNMHQSEPLQSTTVGTEVEVRQLNRGSGMLLQDISCVQMQDECDTALGERMGIVDPGEPTPANDLAKIPVKPKRRQNPNDSKFKKSKEQRKLLYEWAQKKCSSDENVDKEINEVFDHISFENLVEHKEYPCFTAEDVMVYTDPQTQERQIIYPAEKDKKNLPKDTNVRVKYQMWVCGVEKALVLTNQGEKVIEKYESFESEILLCFEGLVFEAFAPALAVFKNLQRQEKFSLIKNH